MVKDIKQDSFSLEASKTKLEQAFARLGRAVDDKAESSDKSKETGLELIAAQQEIAKLREKNKLASELLDSRINQIKKILGS